MIRSSRRFMASVIMFSILICVWVIVYLPPYERIVYRGSRACGYDQAAGGPGGFEGYRGGSDIPVIDAADASCAIPKKTDDLFVLKIGAKNLEPMGIYRPAAYSTSYTAYETNEWKVMLFRTQESYAQYYMASFANGEQIPVLLNDRIVSIPRNGEIVLPIGQVHMDSDLAKVYQGSLADDWYINAVSGFEKSPDMKRFCNTRSIAAVILFIIAVAGTMVWMVLQQRHRRFSDNEKTARRELER